MNDAMRRLRNYAKHFEGDQRDEILGLIAAVDQTELEESKARHNKILAALGESESDLLREMRERLIVLQQRLVDLTRQLEASDNQVALLQRDLKQQLEINERDRERVAWEHRHFSNLIERNPDDSS